MKSVRPAQSFLILSLCTVLAACSKQAENSENGSFASPALPSSPQESVDVASVAGPSISPTAAPGVAFSYAYQFRLPALGIAQVQEQHASACEALGVTRCRITGVRYQVRGENQISASLSLKLAPDIARKFGKDGILTVERAKGMVTDTEIGGTDVGTAITQARRDESDLAKRIADLEAQRNRSGVKDDTRAQLSQQIDSLRDTARSTAQDRAGNEDALASTPMVFNYGSGGLIPGFDAQSPIREALENSGRIIVAIVAFLIQLIAVLLPLTLFVMLIMLLRKTIPARWLAWLRTGQPPSLDDPA